MKHFSYNILSVICLAMVMAGSSCTPPTRITDLRVQSLVKPLAVEEKTLRNNLAVAKYEISSGVFNFIIDASGVTVR